MLSLKEELSGLIELYKRCITQKQKQMSIFERTSRSGACISLQGEIQAYNAIIKDLQNLLNYKP